MTIEEIFLTLLDIIMVFAVPIVLFFLVWAGFLYVTAQGDATKIQTATKALTYGILGGVILLGARVLYTIVKNTINLFG